MSIVLFICQAAGHFEPAFAAFAVATLVSSVLCAWLPEADLSAADMIPAAGGKPASGASATTSRGTAVSGDIV